MQSLLFCSDQSLLEKLLFGCFDLVDLLDVEVVLAELLYMIL
jgi:hypothetical protein